MSKHFHEQIEPFRGRFQVLIKHARVGQGGGQSFEIRYSAVGICRGEAGLDQVRENPLEAAPLPILSGESADAGVDACRVAESILSEQFLRR